jgi:GT2 family glycosyltransferase
MFCQPSGILKEVKLSVVIVCWNGMDLIGECLQSIFAETRDLEFEIIVSDNGSTDGSVEFLKQAYPQVRVIENGANLGYAKGNNAAIRHCTGEYILLLNSDTLVHDGALQKLVAVADKNPRAGAFGCRVLNADGSHQVSMRPFPTTWRDWLDAFCLPHFHGSEARWQSGCCILVRAELLRRLGGFDEQFFYSYEDVDLCWRVRSAGYSIAFTPEARITHLGSRSAGRSPVRFELERHRSRYRYFYKHFGAKVLPQCRYAVLTRIRLRQFAYGLWNLIAPNARLQEKLRICAAAAEWNQQIDPLRFVECGEEPALSSPAGDGIFHSADIVSGKK